MSLTIRDLYKDASKYNMKLLAGKKGLANLMQWVHIIETDEAARFLHGQELVITEGILGTDEKRLLNFVELLYEVNASAVMINTGMFIKEIPASVIAYCDEKELPLFTIPWEIALVDVTREICQKIMENEVRENSIASTMKNLVFHTGNKEDEIRQMERFGYTASSNILFICIALEEKNGTQEYVQDGRQLKYLAERCAKSVKDQFLTFEYQEKRIVCLVDYSKKEIEKYVDQLFKKISALKKLSNIYFGIGDSMKGMENLDVGFKHAYYACEIAVKKDEEHVLSYKELGIYKLLVNVGNRDTLEEFYGDTIGRLISYDKENGTDFHHFLKTYIEFNGHQGNVSETFFIHRNTVNNYVKKMEEIMEIDLLTWEGKSKLFAAYCIESLL